MSNNETMHWADQHADIVLGKSKGKTKITCASGITPSGTIHIGNFREIISTEAVARALKQKGVEVRFIYSWDDYDVFRKVPGYMPKKEMLEQNMRKPINLIPDPYGIQESYARHNEVEIERVLSVVGIEPEYLYQGKRYMSGMYAELMKTALQNTQAIKDILNKWRKNSLEDNWFPVSVFSGFTGTDNTEVLSYDGDYSITYKCLDTGKTETVDLRKTSIVKLPWRVDWPARWSYEDVDYEPAGKDHHSQGGSFTTSKEICKLFNNKQAPHSFQYDFVRMKNAGGKISSSGNEVVSLGDMLEVYTPEIVRYLFLSIKPNQEFAVGFDIDVIRIYEDYDKKERGYFGTDGEKIADKYKRVYELSQVCDIPKTQPIQIPFRHFCNLIQIYDNDIEKCISEYLKQIDTSTLSAKDLDYSMKLLRQRGQCAVNWLNNFAKDSLKKININSIDEYNHAFSNLKTQENELLSKFETAKSGSKKPKEDPEVLMAENALENCRADIANLESGKMMEEMCFSLVSNENNKSTLDTDEISTVKKLHEMLLLVNENSDSKSLGQLIYDVASILSVENEVVFIAVYKALIGKNKGPKLGNFIHTIGIKRTLEILSLY